MNLLKLKVVIQIVYCIYEPLKIVTVSHLGVWTGLVSQNASLINKIQFWLPWHLNEFNQARICYTDVIDSYTYIMVSYIAYN